MSVSQTPLSEMALRFHEIALWAWGLMLLVLPFSTALALLFSAVGVIFSLLGLRRDLVVQTLSSPIVLLALALFSWLMLSTLWSVAPRDELLEGAWKYRKLTFVFLAAASIIACRKRPEFLINFFLMGCAVVAAGSLSSRFGILDLILGAPTSTGGWPIGVTPTGSWFHIGGPDNPTFGRNHITQGALLVFAAMFAVGRAWTAFARGSELRWTGIGWAFAAAFYLIPVFSIQGRSGYLLAVIGAVFWIALALIRLRGSSRIMLPCIIFGCLTALIWSSPHFLKRSAEAVDDVVRYSQTGARTSQGERLGFWQAGLELAAQRPVFGYGVGGYAQAYSELPNQPEALKNSRSQPHSEWVILFVQGGVVAVALFALLALSVIRGIVKRGFREGSADFYGLLLVSSLFFFYAAFNSAVWDLAEGHFFGCLLLCTVGAANVHQAKGNRFLG